jgi:uncharacterized protein YlxW (UPF0749 family)
VPQRHTFLQRHPTRWSALVPVVAALAGLLFATSAGAAKGGNLRSAATGIPDLIQEQTLANERSGRKLASLQSEVDALTNVAAPGNYTIASLRKRGDDLAIAAGRTEMTGKAVKVTLTDAKLTSDQIPTGFTVDDIVVHQQDVQAVVNALWAGGAEAMMLQDQRVISTSAVRCVGNTLILKGRVYSPPYVITAMGDPGKLRDALNQSPQVSIYKQYVTAVGLGYDVVTEPDARFPAYVGSIMPEYATVPRS